MLLCLLHMDMDHLLFLSSLLLFSSLRLCICMCLLFLCLCLFSPFLTSHLPYSSPPFSLLPSSPPSSPPFASFFLISPPSRRDPGLAPFGYKSKGGGLPISAATEY